MEYQGQEVCSLHDITGIASLTFASCACADTDACFAPLENAACSLVMQMQVCALYGTDIGCLKGH